jgi:hypothetical protein
MRRLLLLLVSAALAPAIGQTVHINSVNGTVTIHHPSTGMAMNAVNDSLAVSDTTIVTGPHSSAALDFDYAHSMQLNPGSEFQLVRLEGSEYQTGIARGSLMWRVRADSPAQIEIHTPSITVAPRLEGVYQIGVNSRGESEITAWEGQIEVRAPRGSEWINAGQKMIARGSPADPEYRITRAMSRWKRAAALLAGALRSVNAGGIVSGSSDRKERAERKTLERPHSSESRAHTEAPKTGMGPGPTAGHGAPPVHQAGNGHPAPAAHAGASGGSAAPHSGGSTASHSSSGGSTASHSSSGASPAASHSSSSAASGRSK